MVYSGLQNVTATLASAYGQIFQPFNVDGVGPNDFSLRLRRVGSAGSYTSMKVDLLPRFGANMILNASNQLKKLAAGFSITAGQPFGTVAQNRVLRQYFSNFPGGANPVGGTWASNASGFAGVKFQTGGNTYYGWIRLKWTDTAAPAPANTLTAIDWAYNNTPNAPILAGDTGAPIPEPTRALLALAGAGAAFLRRRRPTNR